METATLEKPSVPEQVDGTKEERTDWFKNLPEDAQKEIIKLRNESGKYRTKAKSVEDELQRLQKLESDVQVEKEKKLADEGKIKELLDAKVKELESLKPKADKVSDYESFFSELLENELKGLNEKYVNLIKNSSAGIKEKYETARQFKIDTGRPISSPAANPPGGENLHFDSLVEQYQKETNATKKMQMLYDVERRDPKLYKQLLKSIGG